MSDLVVIEFPSEAKAEEVRQKLLSMQKEYLIELGDAVIAVKQPNGHVKLNQLVNTTAVGAASGAIGGKLTNLGIDDKFMKEVGASLQSGNAALFLLIRKMTTDKVLEDLKGVGGKVLRTSFDHTKEDELRSALADATTAHAATQVPSA